MRVRRLASLCALVALALAGCIPVPSVVGRPAAVMAQGDERVTLGAGFVDHDLPVSSDVPDLAGSAADFRGYAHGSFAAGLGHRLDASAGANNGQAFAVLRYQPVGLPDGAFRVGGVPIDLSVEIGGSMWAATAFYPVAPAMPYSDVHAGVNVSVPVGRVTPYLSYRHHWGSRRVREGGEDVTRHFEQDMCFLGAEFRLRRPRTGDHRIAVEYFFGRSGDLEPGRAARVSGVNVVYSIVEW